MVIEKNGKIYTVTEHPKKWSVTLNDDKLTAVFDVSKELCQTEEQLRAYVAANNDLF